jgi:hypothetical protein
MRLEVAYKSTHSFINRLNITVVNSNSWKACNSKGGQLHKLLRQTQHGSQIVGVVPLKLAQKPTRFLTALATSNEGCLNCNKTLQLFQLGYLLGRCLAGRFNGGHCPRLMDILLGAHLQGVNDNVQVFIW